MAQRTQPTAARNFAPADLLQGLLVISSFGFWAVMIGLKSHITPLIADDPPRARLATILFWTALLAGIIMIVLRLTSDSAWWTGHRIPTL